MDYPALSSLMTPFILLMGLVMAYQLALRFMRQNEEREFRMRREEHVREDPDNRPTVDHSGYILLKMADAQKPLFLDLLRGFEEFAALKGYRLSFASDASLPDRVAFRFTILEGGIAVSTEKVRRDLDEYIERARSGRSFDDLPEVIPAADHHTTLLILKNRLNFIQSNYTAQRNVLQMYENLTRNLHSLTPPAQNFYLQGGGQMAPTSYSAVNSQQIAQGRDIKMIGNHGSLTLNFGSTHAEREAIISKIQDIYLALYRDKTEATKPQREQAIAVLEKAHVELKDEPEPDPSRLQRYLGKARELFTTTTFAKEAMDAFKELWDLIA